MKEIYKSIEGFENYQISNKGKVKSLSYNNTKKEKILKPKANTQGYLEVTLSKNNKRFYRNVSRLVIAAFTDLKLGKNDIIMYKDNDKTNCALDNMYIISRGKRQEITYDLDRRYRPKYEFYGEILPTKEISKKTGMESRAIRDRMRALYWNIYEAAEIPKGKFNRKVVKDNETRI